ncbi:MAG: hypothetical protein ABMB14_08265 [Myxococcota bacterium]
MLAALWTIAASSAAPVSTEVEVADGGLLWAVHVLASEYRTAVTFEGTPLDREGPEWRWEPSTGARLQTAYGPFRASVPAGSTGIEAVRAVVAAWNARPSPEARYAVREAPGFIHVVPVADADADGILRPYTPVLDTVIHLDRTTGTPTELYQAIAVALSLAAGVPIHDIREGYAMDSEGLAPITVPATGTARDLLDRVVDASDLADTWCLNWSVLDGPWHGWNLWFDRIRPTDDPSGR